MTKFLFAFAAVAGVAWLSLSGDAEQNADAALTAQVVNKNAILCKTFDGAAVNGLSVISEAANQAIGEKVLPVKYDAENFTCATPGHELIVEKIIDRRSIKSDKYPDQELPVVKAEMLSPKNGERYTGWLIESFLSDKS